MSKDLFREPDARTPKDSVELFFQRTPEGYPGLSEVTKAVDKLTDHWSEYVEAGGKRQATDTYREFAVGIRVHDVMSLADFRKLTQKFKDQLKLLIERKS